MWIERVRAVDGGFEGIVSNVAHDTKLVVQGQKVRFLGSEISDWTYVDNGVLVGGFTIRYFFDQMSPEEKKELEKAAGFEIR